jgi:hypothetical protein
MSDGDDGGKLGELGDGDDTANLERMKINHDLVQLISLTLDFPGVVPSYLPPSFI